MCLALLYFLLHTMKWNLLIWLAPLFVCTFIFMAGGSINTWRSRIQLIKVFVWALTCQRMCISLKNTLSPFLGDFNEEFHLWNLWLQVKVDFSFNFQTFRIFNICSGSKCKFRIEAIGDFFSAVLPFKLHKTLSYWKLGIVLAAAAEKETSQVCFLARRFLRWYLKQIRRQVTQKPTGWKWFSGPSLTHHGHQKNGVGRL